MSKTNTALKDLFLVESSASSNLLPEGRFPSRIESITASEAKHDTVNDPTPQAKTVFVALDGTGRRHTEWLNLRGFKVKADMTDEELASEEFTTVTIGDKEYMVNAKSGKRVEDKARTKSCMAIIAGIGEASGIPEKGRVAPDTLVGREVGIVIETNKQGKTRIKSYYKLKAEAAKLTKVKK